MLYDDKITALFCFVDDLLKAINHQEDSRRRISDSEVITTAIVSALYFGGHYDNARRFMHQYNYIPNMLDKSRFCRRLHQVYNLLYDLFMQVGFFLKEITCEKEYILDSFPVPLCDNIRVPTVRILKERKCWGRQASMRRFFYGVKVQLLVTSTGFPVEFCFVPGGENDSRAWNKIPLALAPESCVYTDSAYTNYQVEDMLEEQEAILLRIQRKSNLKRQDTASAAYIKAEMRKYVETTISQIKALCLRKIHAVTLKGFLLKVTLFIFAFTLKKLL